FTAAGDIVNGVSGNAAVGLRVTHGFELHCNPLINPQNLEINWHDTTGKESHFHLLNVVTCTCLDTPIIQRPPDPPIDTLIATGNGRFSGTFNRIKYSNADNFTIEWTFTDGGPVKGEPGIYDTASYLIKDPLGNVVLRVGTKFLTFGNHQAHFENKTAPSSGVNMIHNQIDRTFNALDNANNQDDA